MSLETTKITKIVPQPMELKWEDWQEILTKPIDQRALYKIDKGVLYFGQVVGRFLGIPLDEDDYYNLLFDLSQKPGVCVLSEELDKRISQERFQLIQDVIMVCQKENISVNRLVAFLKAKGLIPFPNDSVFHYQLQAALVEIFKEFEAEHSSGLSDASFRRTIIDLVKWMWNHVENWFKNTLVEKDMPKILWYGDATQSQAYFLYLLLKLGCDLLIFHPEGKDVFAKIDPDQKLSLVHGFPKEADVQPFPKEKRERKSTIAYRASKEIETLINGEDSLLYKPWQFRDYYPSSITLKTTYDELFLVIKEKSFIRPEFQVGDNYVRIPCVFAKVCGISEDRNEYWSRLREISKENDLRVLVRDFPLTKTTKSNYRFHYQQSIGRDGKLSSDKIMQGNWWDYGHLPSGLQKGIAEAISRYCEQPRLKLLPGENKMELQVFLFKRALMLPDEVLKLLQKFDYTQEVPRLILYNNEHNGEISRTDASLLLLLNEIGIDIILFNPAGHNDIENFIDESHFDSHWLADVAFEQEFIDKEPLFMQRVIKKLFQAK